MLVVTMGFLLLQLLAVPATWAIQGAPYDRAILQRSVSVQVAPFPPDAEQLGLRTDQLQTEVEQRLRDAGLTVVPQSWYLYPHVTIAMHVQSRPNMGTSTLGVVLTVSEPVFVLRLEVPSGVPPWGTDFLARAGDTPDNRRRRAAIGDLLREFIATALAPMTPAFPLDAAAGPMRTTFTTIGMARRTTDAPPVGPAPRSPDALPPSPRGADQRE